MSILCRCCGHSLAHIFFGSKFLLPLYAGFVRERVQKNFSISNFSAATHINVSRASVAHKLGVELLFMTFRKWIFVILFVSILCTCCSHFFLILFYSLYYVLCSRFFPNTLILPLSNFIIPSKCLKNFICAILIPKIKKTIYLRNLFKIKTVLHIEPSFPRLCNFICIL